MVRIFVMTLLLCGTAHALELERIRGKTGLSTGEEAGTGAKLRLVGGSSFAFFSHICTP